MNASPQASWHNRNPHQQQQHLTDPQHQKIPAPPNQNNNNNNNSKPSAQPTTYWRQPTPHQQAGYSSSTGGSTQASECHAAEAPPLDHTSPARAASQRSSSQTTTVTPASYLRMRAPSSQLYGPDSALVAAGGHRMALKLASPGAARWHQQHQPVAGYGPGATNGTGRAECRSPECCGLAAGDCSSDLVELLSDCSCSDSLDFQCATGYHQHAYATQQHLGPHQHSQHQHLSSRRPASEQHQQQHLHQSLKLAPGAELGARYASRYSVGAIQSRSPSPPPPAPPPPPLLVNQNTYTTTRDTLTDSLMLAAPVDELCHQGGGSSQLRRQRRSNSIETDPLLIEDLTPQHHRHAVGHTMSLGRANHLHHHHHHHQLQQVQHPQLAAEFMHKPVAGPVNKGSNKRQQHSVSFRRSAANPAALPASAHHQHQQQQQQQPSDKLSAVQHHNAQWTPNHLLDQPNLAAPSRQQLDYAGARPLSHSHKLPKEPATNGAQKKAGAARHRNNNQIEQPAPINHCTSELSPVSAARLSPETACVAAACGQQQQASSVAIYPPGSPLAGPTSPAAAQELHSQHQPAPHLGAPLGAGGHASGAVMGDAVLQLQPVTTSHRNYAHWMRVSSIVLTPVGLIIILFIVVSPLLHYLM